MKIIIFAGGNGKRFWPLSRRKLPKQFLSLIDNKPLLKIRYDLLLEHFRKEDIYISTGEQYGELCKEILPDMPEENLILEKEMRDNGPAVVLAMNYIYHKDKEAVVSIQWSDHLIKHPTKFIEGLKAAEKEVVEKKKTVFFTVPARYPSPHLGYIHFGRTIKYIDKDGYVTLLEFKGFKEKPDMNTAREYLKSGEYGWNPGYWVAKAEDFLDKVKVEKPEFIKITDEIVQNWGNEKIAKKYAEMEKISIDYIFSEKLSPSEASTMLAEIGWSDVGEWSSYKEAVQHSDEANVVKGNVIDMDSEDTVIYNKSNDKLISTIGLNGMVVVNTDDVIAVFPKNDNSSLKKYLDKLEEEGRGELL